MCPSGLYSLDVTAWMYVNDHLSVWQALRKDISKIVNVCVCVFVFGVCVCVCVYIYIYIYIYVCVYVCVRIYIYIRASTLLKRHTHTLHTYMNPLRNFPNVHVLALGRNPL